MSFEIPQLKQKIHGLFFMTLIVLLSVVLILSQGLACREAFAAVSLRMPDLVVSTGRPTATPAKLKAGVTVRLSAWTVKNVGSATAPKFYNGFYLSKDSVITPADKYLTGNSNLALPAGRSFTWGAPTLTIPANTVPGIYYVGILLDRTNSVRERNEGNNYVSVPIIVARPDLTISTGRPTVTPSTVTVGGTVKLNAWTVRNLGVVASTGFSNGFYISRDPVISPSDTLLTTNNNTGLAAGASFSWGAPTIAIPASITPGTYYIGIMVDRTNAVLEGNEGNNYVSVPITVIPNYPDLTITTGTPTANPSAVIAGGSVTLSSWTVKNIGTTASSGFTNGFYLSRDPVITQSDTILSYNNNNGLAAGEDFVWGAPTLIIPASTAPGTYYIGILTDYPNTVAEGNEANNYVSVPITVLAPKPDLTITSGTPTVYPTVVTAGGTITLSSWKVKNIGTAAAGFFYNGFHLSQDSVITSSDPYLSNNSSGGLGVGAEQFFNSMTLTIPSNTTPGTYYVGIQVDSTNIISEVNESNNYVSVPITVVAPKPDLTITSGTPTANPTVVFAGRTITLSSWIIKNIGQATASGFSNGFYLSTDSVITAYDTYLDGNSNSAGLAAGGTLYWGGPTLTIPSSTPTGNYYIGIRVDTTNAVNESNEGNNYVSVPISVIRW